MPLVFIISAPSGSGKSTLVQRLMEADENLAFSTSVTTRPPRPGEIDGSSYHFVTREQFLAMRENGELLEWAEVFDHFYGTSKTVLEQASAAHRDLLLDIDVQGAAQLKEKLPEAVTIFILPPSRQVLEERLRHRSSDPDEVIKRRLADAKREVANFASYDYVLVNDQIDASLDRLRGVLLAERSRQKRMAPLIRPILESFEVESEHE